VTENDDINLTPNALEFNRLLKRLGEIKNLNLHLFPVRTRLKSPDVIGSWLDVRIRPDSALARINELHSNVAIVAHETATAGDPVGLCFIDVDLQDGKFLISQKQIDELLAIGTLVVKTKSGGLQLYFQNKGITQWLRAKGYSANPAWSVAGVSGHCGEIRTDNAYVLAPGSFAPVDLDPKKGSISGATGLYSVFADNPIKELTPEVLPKWILLSNEEIAKEKQKNVKLQEEFIGKAKQDIDSKIGFDPITAFKKITNPDEIVNEKGLTLSFLMDRDKEFTEILTVVGEKGTRSERDWYVCRRMRSMGFNPNQVARALITYRPYRKTAGGSEHEYIRNMSLTIRNAFTHEIAAYDPHQSLYANVNVTDISKTSAENLPDNLPDKKFVLIQAPPRTGKTHWSVGQLVKAKSGVYTSNKHEIIKHAIGIFERIEKKRTAVYLVGKDRACNCMSGRGECGTCPKRPAVHPGFDEKGHIRGDVLTVTKLRQTAMDLLMKHRVLTPEILMDNAAICPYYVLLLAEYEADFCFTIPYFLTSEREIKRVKRANRNLLVIDEDPVVTSFYPTEYEIASYSYGRGNKSFNNTLGSYINIIETIETKINEQKRKKQVDKEILRMCGIIHQINDRIDGVVDTTTMESKKEFDDWIKSFDISNDYDLIMKQNIEKRLIQFEQDLKESDHEVELFPIFAPLVYVADKSFVWIGGSPSKTLYFIPDRHPLYRPPDFYKTVLIIGATQSELYIQDICPDAKDSEIVTIDKFKYADNFVLLLLKGETRKEETRMLYSLLFKFAHANTSSNFVSPALCLTSSKKKQQKLEGMLKSKCVSSTDQGEQEQIALWLLSNINIFYSNSTLSRGLDIPQYSTMFVESVKFAIPYFTALLEHAQETGNVQLAKKCKAIISKITVDEITNSVLRHSPIVDDPTETFKKEDRVKIIVIRDRDVGTISTSVRSGMYEMEVNSIENLDFGFKLLTQLPEWFNKASIFKTLAQYSPEPILRHYCGTSDRKNPHKNSIFSPTSAILKPNLKSFLESELLLFPKNNAAALVDPKIKTIVEFCPGLKRGERVGETALLNYVSSNMSKGKGFNKVEQTVEVNKKQKDNKGFDPLVIDKGKAKRDLPFESKIKKNIVNMVRGELLKEEMDKGRRFYRMFNKVIFGEPKDSKGNAVV
jgi:hypothetical protein